MPATSSTSTAAATPRAVFEHLLAAITSRRWAELPDLYAEDTVVEQPFQLPAPLRLEGRAQLRDHFAAATSLPIELAARNVVVHETLDPEVVVGEFDYDVHVPTSGRRFSVANIIVMRVRNGQIVASRDYHNHAILADALRPV
jgi:ketosteroid isomerase-like protein